MGSERSTKNLIGRVDRDPWKAVLGSRPDRYQIDEVGVALIRSVDRALFERKIREALTAGVILEKWAEHNIHFNAQAPAVMSSVYSVCQLFADAEVMIITAQKRLNPRCIDSRAQYMKRLGTLYFHQQDHESAVQAYNDSADLFISINKPEEAAVSVLNRGASRYLMKKYDLALRDEEHALVLLGSRFNMYTIMCSINLVAILVAQKKLDEALRRIESLQGNLVGENDIERPKLILRWIRALLLEAQGKLTAAREMIDRIEPRMRKLDMKSELKVLLADRARIARQTDTIQGIASRALNLEDIPRIMRIIESVVDEPSRENIIAWRNALDAYVPPFPTTI